MRRIGRIFRTLLVGTIVLAWIAFVGLWIRSHWRGDQVVVELQRPTTRPWPLQQIMRSREWIAMSGDGGICLATRVREISSAETKSHLTANLDTKPNPSYPQPWATAVFARINIPQGGVLSMGGALGKI